MTGHKPWCKYGLTLLSDPPKDIPCDCETQHYKRDNDYWIPEMRKEQRRVSDRVNADARAMAERVAQEVERQYQAAVAERDQLRAELAAAKKEAVDHATENSAMRFALHNVHHEHAAAIAEAEERALEWACSVQHARWTDYKSASEAWDKHGTDLVRAYRASQKQREHQPWCVMSRTVANEVFKREQPCGCIICYCADDEQCNGCGSKTCDLHTHVPLIDRDYEIESATCTCERRVAQQRDGKDRRAWGAKYDGRMRRHTNRRKADRRRG